MTNIQDKIFEDFKVIVDKELYEIAEHALMGMKVHEEVSTETYNLCLNYLEAKLGIDKALLDDTTI